MLSIGVPTELMELTEVTTSRIPSDNGEHLTFCDNKAPFCLLLQNHENVKSSVLRILDPDALQNL
jgi:hypothetical protein